MRIRLSLGSNSPEDKHRNDQLTISERLYDDAQQVRRFWQFAVAAELVLFGVMPWTPVFVLMSSAQALACIYALFTSYIMTVPSITAYRDKIEQFSGDDSYSSRRNSNNRADDRSTRFFRTLNSRAERIVLVSLFTIGVYLFAIYSSSIIRGGLALPDSDLRTNLIRVIVIFTSASLCGLSWWAHRPMVWNSVEIPPDANGLGDRLIRFVDQRQEELSRYLQEPFILLIKLGLSIVGIRIAYFGLMTICEGSVLGLPLLIVGFLAIWPVPHYSNKIFDTSITIAQTFTLVISIIASWLVLQVAAIPSGIIMFILWIVLTVLPTFIIRLITND